MSVITNKWIDGSGDSISIESPSFQGNQTVKISSPINAGTSARTMRFIGKCKKDSSKQVVLIVEQEFAIYRHVLKIGTSGIETTRIAAKGGTVNIAGTLTTYRKGTLEIVSSERVVPVLSGNAPGFSISGNKVTASNRTTVVGAERSITVTGTYSKTLDGQTVTAEVVITQEANTVSYSDITITKKTPINLSANMHIILKKFDDLSYSQKATYTSGATTDITTGADITYLVQNPVTGFKLLNDTLIVTSNESFNPRNGFVVRINISLNGKIAIKDITYNQAAGYYTYADPVVTLTCNDVPASGGSVKTGNVTYSQTYGWNGATTGAGVITGGRDHITWIGGVDNIPSLGTTVKSRTKVGVLGVAVNINGKYGDVYVDIYQAANAIDSYNYGSWNIAISANPTTIAASGGTSTITASCTRTKTPVYTSGSTGTATSESATPTLALTTNPGGFTLNGNKLTAANNPNGAKTAIVTASYSGATSKSVTITQSARPDGIGYMQIQGNGVDHYIFQVGRTPNTRSNDVQTLSEEPAEVATETKSESLFAKIKRIVTNLN